MENYFIRNLETQKMELYFSKATYQILSEELKKDIRSNCLFSNHKKAWISRAKLDNLWRLSGLLKQLNLQDAGTTGEKLSFAEQVENEQERAANRAERMENRADKAEKESTQYYEQAHKLGDMIPFGQPILVGHHSEGMHRRHIAKIDNNMRKSCEATEKAAYYADKANTAEWTANGAKFNNAGYLVNRIKECETNLRTYERRLQGKFYAYDEPKPISEETKAHWEGRITEETEKMNFFTEKLKALAQVKTVWSKETLSDKKEVLIRGRWEKIVRLNPKTITAITASFPFPLKYNYGEVKDAR